MKINYIDIAFLALMVIALLCGLCGKAKKKFRKLLVFVISIVVSYFTFDKLRDYLYTIQINGGSLESLIFGAVEGALNGNEMLGGLKSMVMPMLNTIVGFVVFWVEILALLIVGNILFAIIFGIIGAVIKHKHPSHRPLKAYKTFGLLGLVNGFLGWLYVLLPLLFLSPVLGNANNVIGIVPGVNEMIPESAMGIIDGASTQIKESKLVELSGKLFTLPGNKLMEYEVEGETKNVYTDLASVGSLTKAAGLVSSIMSSDEGFSPEALLNGFKDMSSEDLVEVLGALDNNKELLESIIPADTLSEMGIDLSEISFADEAPVITLMLDVIEFNDEGEMNFNLDNLDEDDLTDALIESNLIQTFIQPGMLGGLPEETQNSLIDKFDEKLGDGTIDQDKYDLLMSFINGSDE